MNYIIALFSNTLIAFLLLVSVVVVAHELGHFLVGRWLGIGVEEFSIGFGPKIFSFKIGTTEYRVNWVLLGGYVRFYGADTEKEISPQDRERSILHAKLYKRMCVSFAGPFANFILSLFIMSFLYSFGVSKQPAIFRVLDNSIAYNDGLRSGDHVLSIDGKKIADWSVLMQQIASSPDKPLNFEVDRSGENKKFVVTPRSNVVTGFDGVVQTVGRVGITPFFSEPIIAPWENQFFSQIGLIANDKIISIDPIAPKTSSNTNSSSKIQFLDQVLIQVESITQSHSDVELAKRILNNQTNQTHNFKIIILRNNIIQNLNVNLQSNKMRDWARHVLANFGKSEHGAWMSSVASSELSIASFTDETVSKKSPHATNSLVECGLKPNDTIRKINDSQIFASQVDFYSWIETETNHINKNINQFKNNSIRTDIMVTTGSGKAKIYSCFLPIRNDRNQANNEKLFIDFPVKFVSNPALYPPLKIQGKNIFDSVKLGFNSVLTQTTFIYSGFKKLFSGLVPLSTLGGPIAIAGFAGDAAKAGFETFLIAMSLMSINIGIFNLLPLPALDGGTLLLQIVEMLYRKPIPKKVQMTIARFGIAFLLTLFIFVFYNDIIRLFYQN